jgi:hypothetical protein
MARLGTWLRGANADAGERTLADPPSALVVVGDATLSPEVCAVNARVPSSSTGLHAVDSCWRGADEGLAFLRSAAGVELRKDKV